MLTITSRHAIEQGLVDLCWSLWTELGVAGVIRRHATWNIDPEILIVLTAALRDIDPRLRDESTDWCIHYARLIAAIRLKAFIGKADAETVTAFEEFAATVAAHVRVNWPGAGTARRYHPTGRSRLDSLDRPSLFSLRLRAIFGTGARAEVIRVLASNPDSAFSAAELADEAAFTKRAVEQEIESLRLAGLVTWTVLHGRRHIRLAQPGTLLDLIGSRPQWLPRWAPMVHVLLGGLRLVSRVETSAPIVRNVEARKFLREMQSEIDQAGFVQPEPVIGATGQWNELERWLRWATATLAAADSGAFAPGRVWSSRPGPMLKTAEDER